jgi:hypothetical protein
MSGSEARADARYMWQQQLRIAPESNSDAL